MHVITDAGIAIVGAGRLGRALASAMIGAELRVIGPLGRGADAKGADIVLLCVPDSAIAAAAALIEPGVLVGHCSGISDLTLLAPHEAFSMHPLMTVTGGASVSFAGAGCAVSGTTDRAREIAESLASRLRMRPFRLKDADRPLYHAAASMASNYLVTLEDAAEQLMAEVGVERDLLVPLVRAAVENWARLGARGALTGPIVRGDITTAKRQRDAIAERSPDLLPFWDALAAATRSLARERPA
jgi:predicted short-subunit dehydrogenase-like oxidoreductase (DUF2520 family)